MLLQGIVSCCESCVFLTSNLPTCKLDCSTKYCSHALGDFQREYAQIRYGDTSRLWPKTTTANGTRLYHQVSWLKALWLMAFGSVQKQRMMLREHRQTSLVAENSNVHCGYVHCTSSKVKFKRKKLE